MGYLSFSATDKIRTKIQRLQNTSLRMALCWPPCESIVSLHSQACVMLLNVRYEFNLLKVMHHMVYACNQDIDFIKNQHLDVDTRARMGPVIFQPIPSHCRFCRSMYYKGAGALCGMISALD